MQWEQKKKGDEDVEEEKEVEENEEKIRRKKKRPFFSSISLPSSPSSFCRLFPLVHLLIPYTYLCARRLSVTSLAPAPLCDTSILYRSQPPTLCPILPSFSLLYPSLLETQAAAVLARFRPLFCSSFGLPLVHPDISLPATRDFFSAALLLFLLLGVVVIEGRPVTVAGLPIFELGISVVSFALSSVWRWK